MESNVKIKTMKKLITICLFMATSYTVSAQQLTFEETVNYINKIFTESQSPNYFVGNDRSGEGILGIQASKNGKVTVYNKWLNSYETTSEYNTPVGSFNLFDFEKCGTESERFITLLDKNNQKLGMFSNLLISYSTKMEKALKHLRSLCTKEPDPFGN